MATAVIDGITTRYEVIGNGVPLLMFPEGHRSETGELIEFHGGAFKVALSSGSSVAPIVVDGTWPIYRGFRVQPCPGRITIRILEPIAPEEAGGSAERLRLLAFERIQAELASIRGIVRQQAV